MAESLADLLTWLGLGGLVGAAAALKSASKRFASRLAALRESLEASLRDPRRADIPGLIDEIRLAEAELRSGGGILRGRPGP
jgi:hypothetical protein